MNNAEQMQENDPESSPTIRRDGMKRCHQCSGRFGLVRHRSGLKQFCSKGCLSRYKVAIERQITHAKHWTEFLAGTL
jgi:hypothetical protein